MDPLNVLAKLSIVRRRILNRRGYLWRVTVNQINNYNVLREFAHKELSRSRYQCQSFIVNFLGC